MNTTIETDDILIGDFDPELDRSDRLVVVFHPGAGMQHWRRAAWTADFAAGWFGARSSADDIAYALNELVENAIKFTAGGAVTVELCRLPGELSMRVDNRTTSDTVPAIEARFTELVTGDPWELMIARVEENADNPESTQSGLGFLTLLTDYGARLGWCITRSGQPEHHALVRTMVRLPMSEDG